MGRKRLTNDDFILRARLAHGDKYDYSKTDYIKDTVHVCVICKTCNKEFYTRPSHHLRGTGCPYCAKMKLRGNGNKGARRLKYGVGIIDYEHNATELKSFSVWCNILQRCYDNNLATRYPTYQNCKVCDEWLLLSNFDKWYNENYVEGYDLDKDILSGKDNKIYSPETCCFVPREINSLLTRRNSKRGIYPIGVSRKTKGKYSSTLQKDGKSYHIGCFDSIEDAFIAYKRAKESHIKKVATKYFKEGKISEKVYNALMNYTVEITD